MALVNYNEFTNSLNYEGMDTVLRWGENFPERLSRLHCTPDTFSPASRRQNRRSRDRYKTQPITFDEITEVDEDVSASKNNPGNEHNSSKQRNTSDNFSRSIDGLWLESGRSCGLLTDRISAESKDKLSTTSISGDEIFQDTAGREGSSPGRGGAGFSAAVEGARRRRKYSKRGRARRNSDMTEEENTVPEEIETRCD